MANRFQIALGKNKENPVVLNLRKKNFPEVKDTDARRERAALLSSLLDQAIDAAGVPVKEETPRVEQTLAVDDIRYNPNSDDETRRFVSNHLRFVSNHLSRQRRHRRTPRQEDDDIHPVSQHSQDLGDLDLDQALDQILDDAGAGVSVTRTPGSTLMTLRGPGGFNANVPIRMMSASESNGSLMLRLPGDIARRFMRDFNAARALQRGS